MILISYLQFLALDYFKVILNENKNFENYFYSRPFSFLLFTCNLYKVNYQVMSRFSKMRINSVHSTQQLLQQPYQPTLFELKLLEGDSQEYHGSLTKTHHHNTLHHFQKSIQKSKITKPQWYEDPQLNETELQQFQSSIVNITRKPFSGITKEQFSRVKNTQDYMKLAKQRKKIGNEEQIDHEKQKDNETSIQNKTEVQN